MTHYTTTICPCGRSNTASAYRPYCGEECLNYVRTKHGLPSIGHALEVAHAALHLEHRGWKRNEAYAGVGAILRALHVPTDEERKTAEHHGLQVPRDEKESLRESLRVVLPMGTTALRKLLGDVTALGAALSLKEWAQGEASLIFVSSPSCGKTAFSSALGRMTRDEAVARWNSRGSIFEGIKSEWSLNGSLLQGPSPSDNAAAAYTILSAGIAEPTASAILKASLGSALGASATAEALCKLHNSGITLEGFNDLQQQLEATRQRATTCTERLQKARAERNALRERVTALESEVRDRERGTAASEQAAGREIDRLRNEVARERRQKEVALDTRETTALDRDRLQTVAQELESHLAIANDTITTLRVERDTARQQKEEWRLAASRHVQQAARVRQAVLNGVAFLAGFTGTVAVGVAYYRTLAQWVSAAWQQAPSSEALCCLAVGLSLLLALCRRRAPAPVVKVEKVDGRRHPQPPHDAPKPHPEAIVNFPIADASWVEGYLAELKKLEDGEEFRRLVKGEWIGVDPGNPAGDKSIRSTGLVADKAVGRRLVTVPVPTLSTHDSEGTP